MEDEEKAYLYRLIDAINYNENFFSINYGAENNGKVVFGAFFQSGNINKFFVYKTLYDTIVYTNTAIRRSLKTAIPYAYVDTENYDPFFPSKSEQEAAYYIENTVFRTIILWDILAQLYNAKYDIERDASRIFYKEFFKKQLASHDAIISKTITEYIEQSDNTNTEPWEGNHEYINAYRNQMTHRNSPNIPAYSEYALEFRLPARYVLKRIVEEYSAVSNFISEFISGIDFKQLLTLE